MSTNAFGIDLGTSNIKIYSAADDKIMIEKNMIAVQNKKNVFAYGDSAYEMYEKPPETFIFLIRCATESLRISRIWKH